MWKKGIGLTGLILVAGIGLFFWTGAKIEQGLEPRADGHNDYAILLGAKVKKNGSPSLTLQYRLEAAEEYLRAFPNVKLILSGGQGDDEPMSEADLMYRFLVDNGIEEERLIREDASTSTYENILYSMHLLPEGVTEVTIISSDFHLARGQDLAKRLGLEVDVVPAKTPKVVETKLQLREKLALLKTWIIGR